MFVSIIGRNSVCRDLTSFLLAAFVIALSVFSRASAVANTDTVNTEAVLAGSQCATGYHSALNRIYTDKKDELKNSLIAAYSKDKTLPGRWYFRPDVALPKKVKRRKGRKQKKSAEPDEAITIQAPGAAFSRQERALLSLANGLILARGMDPRFRRKGAYRWISQRVSADLRTYTGQTFNPAICTGTNQIMSHFEDSLKKFKMAVDKMAGQSDQAAGFAHRRVDEVGVLMRARGDKGADIAAHSVTLNAGVARDSASLREILAELARLGGADELAGELAGAPDIFRALKQAASLGRQAGGRDKSVKLAYRRALTMIEAAAYIARVERHFADIDNSLFDTIALVRQAHAVYCVCAR